MRVNNGPSTKVVQVAGLHFQFSRLRARRGLRSVASLIDLLGAPAARIITGLPSNGVTIAMVTSDGGLSAVARMLATAAMQAGNMHNPDTVERVANELLSYADGQGTQVSTDGAGWMPVRGIASLDHWEMIGHMEMLDILRHVIVFEFFPTSAGSPTGDGTAPAEQTSAEASGTNGASPGAQTSAPSGLVAG